MNIEISQLVILFLSFLLSGYASVVSYMSKKRDEDIRDLKEKVTELEVKKVGKEDLKETVENAVTQALMNFKNTMLEEELKRYKERK